MKYVGHKAILVPGWLIRYLAVQTILHPFVSSSRLSNINRIGLR